MQRLAPPSRRLLQTHGLHLRRYSPLLGQGELEAAHAEPVFAGAVLEGLPPGLEDVCPALPSFHELSCSGYNGRLALAYRSSNRTGNILAIMETMRSAGERPTSVLCYNYMLSALLDAGRRKDAFYLLHDMEARGMQPDVFTFELLLLDLCRQQSMAITVEELFNLMQARYGLKPSSICWDARLRAWMWRNGEHRVLQLYDEMRTSGGRVADDPQLYASAARVAFMRGSWTLLAQMLARIGTAPGQIVWTSNQWHLLLLSRIGRLSIQCVPILRVILKHLSDALLDEGAYVRILYFCSSLGDAVADLAFVALSKLSRIYAQLSTEKEGPVALPRAYLEAFLECVETPCKAQYLSPPWSLESRLEEKHEELARKVRSLLHIEHAQRHRSRPEALGTGEACD